jgi:hypothetical protein
MEETVEYQRQTLQVLEKILAADLRIEALQEKILAVDEKILKVLTANPDVSSFKITAGTPIKQGA